MEGFHTVSSFAEPFHIQPAADEERSEQCIDRADIAFAVRSSGGRSDLLDNLLAEQSGRPAEFLRCRDLVEFFADPQGQWECHRGDKVHCSVPAGLLLH